MGIPDARRQRGNALFLILIAVALFAALSYAITLSGRSGGSGTSGETATINAALITDYPAAVKTGVTRMVLGNITANTIDYSNGATGTAAVFDAAGGAVAWITAPPANAQDTATVDATHAGPNWRFKAVTSTTNKGYYIAGIGGTTSASGQDAFAFVGVTGPACVAINRALNIGDVYPEGYAISTTFTTSTAATESQPTHALGFSQERLTTGSAVNTIGKYYMNNSVGAQAFACVSNSATVTTGPFVYYHAVLEQ
jgi:hypothetical protein